MDTGQDKYLEKETRALTRQKEEQRKRLGEILVDQSLMLPVTVERLVVLAQKNGKRFGALLEELGVVTAEELAEALATQYRVKVLKEFAHLSFSAQTLGMVPLETAIDECMFPLKVEGGLLAIAISDPTNLKIATNIAINSGMRLIPFVGTRKEINKAISKHYLQRDIVADSRKKILVVESDRTLRQVLSAPLQRQGYAVYEAEDGMEAFKSVLSINPHVILTNRDMPKLDGYMLFDSIKKFPEMSRTPVILMSSITSADDEAAAFQKGFFDFIPKPVKEPTLLVKVQRALAASSLY